MKTRYVIVYNNDLKNFPYFQKLPYFRLLKIARRKRPAHVDPSHSTSGSLLAHLGPIDGHMRCPIIQFLKNEFRKICGRTDIRKKVTSKDPFREYARDLKISSLSFV